MRMRRCSGLSTNISPPSDQNAWPPRELSGSWSTSSTFLPASASSAVATRPARPAPTTITSASTQASRRCSASRTVSGMGTDFRVSRSTNTCTNQPSAACEPSSANRPIS